MAFAPFALMACSGSPEQAMQQGALAQSQLEAGQIAAAQRTIADAVGERDDIIDLHLLRGRIEFAAGNVGGAFRAYDDALGLDPTNMEALQAVAQLGLRTGDLEDSEMAADRILTLQPNEVNALLMKGIHRMVHNRAGEALELANRVIEQDPANDGGIILKARALFFEGREAEALKAIRDREATSGRTEAVALTELELLREAHDSKGMLEVFATLRSFRPSDVDLRLDEANLLYKLGQVAEARQLATSALHAAKLSPAQLDLLSSLWREYDPEPLSAADRASLVSVAIDRRLAVARHYLRVQQPQLAAPLVSDVSSVEGRGVAARVAASLGQRTQAASLANSVLQSDETQCDALIAKSMFSAGKEAVYSGQRAIAECPQDVMAALALTNAYDRAGDRSGVLRSFGDAVTRIPQDSQLSRAFTTWLIDNGKLREAVGEARRLTRKAPAFLSAWRNYRNVATVAADKDSVSEAEAGLSRAQHVFGFDPVAGKLEGKGLSGRLQRR